MSHVGPLPTHPLLFGSGITFKRITLSTGPESTTCCRLLVTAARPSLLLLFGHCRTVPHVTEGTVCCSCWLPACFPLSSRLLMLLPSLAPKVISIMHIPATNWLPFLPCCFIVSFCRKRIKWKLFFVVFVHSKGFCCFYYLKKSQRNGLLALWMVFKCQADVGLQPSTLLPISFFLSNPYCVVQLSWRAQMPLLL